MRWVGPAAAAPAGEVARPRPRRAPARPRQRALPPRAVAPGRTAGRGRRLRGLGRAPGHDASPGPAGDGAPPRPAGIQELEDTGTVAVGDVSNTLAHLDLLADSSLRARVFFELIGWDPGGRGPGAWRRRTRAWQPRTCADTRHGVAGRPRAALRLRGAPARDGGGGRRVRAAPGGVAARAAVPARPRRRVERLPRPPRAGPCGVRAAASEPGRLRRPARRAAPGAGGGPRRAGGRRRLRAAGRARRVRRPLPAQQPRARRRPRSRPRAARGRRAPGHRDGQPGQRADASTSGRTSSPSIAPSRPSSRSGSCARPRRAARRRSASTISGASRRARRPPSRSRKAPASLSDPLAFLLSGEARLRGVAAVKTLVDRALVYGRMIKFSHSVFALPFALASAAVAARRTRAAGASCPGSWWPWSARAARPWDSTAWPTRPSTRATRARPAASCRAACSRAREVWALRLLSSALALVGAAAMLNPLCLAPLAGGAARRVRVLVHQAVHVALAPRARPRPRHRARRRLAGRPRPVRRSRRSCSRWPSSAGWPASTPSTPARTSTSTGARGCAPCPRSSASAARLIVARVLHVAAVVLLAALYTLAPPASRLPGRRGGGGRAPRLRALPGVARTTSRASTPRSSP